MPSKGNAGAGGEPRTGRLARGYDAGLMAASNENSLFLLSRPWESQVVSRMGGTRVAIHTHGRFECFSTPCHLTAVTSGPLVLLTVYVSHQAPRSLSFRAGTSPP